MKGHPVWSLFTPHRMCIPRDLTDTCVTLSRNVQGNQSNIQAKTEKKTSAKHPELHLLQQPFWSGLPCSLRSRFSSFFCFLAISLSAFTCLLTSASLMSTGQLQSVMVHPSTFRIGVRSMERKLR